MRFLSKLLLCAIAAIISIGCTDSGKQESATSNADSSASSLVPNCNSIYHWKTTFNLTPTEIEFLKEHNIGRIYVKMFDVAPELDLMGGAEEINPIATTKFLSPIPEGVEIVPVVFITIDALRAMKGQEGEYASLIVERALAMCRHNNCGTTLELQLDCDWTSTTKASYNILCKAAKDILTEYKIALSTTIRLHQLRESAPPADRGVLMLYNTGALKDPQTKNSILDINDARPYIKELKYPIPLNYAYPAFGWGIKFRDNEFAGIVTNEDTPLEKGEYIRRERVAVEDILEVKNLVEKNLGKAANHNILYHLDETQLKNYTKDEISQIFTN